MSIKNSPGSSSEQIMLFTKRILNVAGHVKNNKKDNVSQRGLMKLINKRKKLLKYLFHYDYAEYEKVTEQCNIRK